MKQTILLFLVVVGSVASAQTIRIADKNPNRPTGNNIYSTVQAAVDAALPDDIVYIQPAETQYAEDVNVGKRITMIGLGHGVSEFGARNSYIREN
jgi:pectin methylesterase-like acyl-CoA thioesterase